MDVQRRASRFEQAVSGLCPDIQKLLSQVPLSIKQTAFEIRLRVGAPIALTCPGHTWFVDEQSRLSNLPAAGAKITAGDISDSVVRLCSYSVHSHQEEMKNGYISMVGGHRAGLCGSAVIKDGTMTAVRDISSLNIRIAQQVRGAADALMREIFCRGLTGVLIVGAPCSGKTTVLRDLARQLGSGNAGQHVKVAVVDERGEIAAVQDGVAQNDMGYSCDILNGYSKREGILMAVRTLSPQIIICDEIGSEAEAEQLIECMNSGVHIVASTHAASLQELMRRPHIRRLIYEGAFEQVLLLDGGEIPGKIQRIERAGDLYAQSGGGYADSGVFGHDRLTQSS